ncbi:AAA family ATPase [Gordonia polyisoprenivorans]|uniref:AAA family ATPase n=1 Tax=Gordonia polyisoprenivorans TaxID=84595 RepID=UPI0011D2BBD6|nr:AAA family ATPase [Gordonia polyisoprenivorans]
MSDFTAQPAGRKTTLNGLRQRFDTRVMRPQSLQRSEFDQLDSAARSAYDDQRLQWFSNGLIVKTPALRRLTLTGLSLMRMHDPGTVGERGIVLTGPPHIGKTTALIRLAAEIEAWMSRRHPDFRDRGHVPVAYIEMEPKASPKSIASSILNFYGIPHNFKSATQHQLTDLALDALRRHHTGVLIIDELQMLKLDGKTGDDAINSLQTIMNDFGAICVFAGVDLLAGLSSRPAEQIMARCQVTQMRPFLGSDDTSRGQWAALVNSLGTAMQLLDAEPDHLAPFADILLTMSNGKIGDLRSILALAMAGAIDDREETGSESITQDHLIGVGQIGVA